MADCVTHIHSHATLISGLSYNWPQMTSTSQWWWHDSGMKIGMKSTTSYYNCYQLCIYVDQCSIK